MAAWGQRTKRERGPNRGDAWGGGQQARGAGDGGRAGRVSVGDDRDPLLVVEQLAVEAAQPTGAATGDAADGGGRRGRGEGERVRRTFGSQDPTALGPGGRYEDPVGASPGPAFALGRQGAVRQEGFDLQASEPARRVFVSEQGTWSKDRGWGSASWKPQKRTTKSGHDTPAKRSQ